MKNTIKNILFSLIIVILFFTALELIYRIKVAYTEKDPTFLFYGQAFLELKVKSVFNKTSDLFYENTKEENLRNKVIWTFGGSTTLCTPYVRKDDSWPNKMENYLNEKLHSPVKVVNMAMQGTLCKDYVERYKELILEGEAPPDLTIFYMGINDAAMMAFYPEHKKQNKKIKVSFLDWINSRLMYTSLLYASLKEEYIQSVKQNIDRAWQLQNAGFDSDMTFFENNVNQIIHIAKDFKSRLIFCSVPISPGYFADSPETFYTFQNVNRIIKDTAHEERIYFIDMHEDIYKKHNEFANYYVDGIHINEKGNDLVARHIADFILENDILL